VAFEAKVIADSLSAGNVRLTTMQLKFPRMVLSEFNTHRMFSRNASSSRAIPVKTLLKRVREEPAMPAKWGKNVKGMQAAQFFEGAELVGVQEDWLKLRDMVADYVEEIFVKKWNLHKQLANRPLETWMHCYVVVTATDWDNFMNLRCHPDAQAEIEAEAQAMRQAMHDSEPKRLEEGEWHLPYVLEEDISVCGGYPEPLLKVSCARCARVSYRTHDGSKPNLEGDVELHNMLLSSGHMSPLEHPAKSLGVGSSETYFGNFKGWLQYRKTIFGENVFNEY